MVIKVGFEAFTVGWATNADASSRHAAVVGAIGWHGCLARHQSIAFKRHSKGAGNGGEQSNARGEGESDHSCGVRLDFSVEFDRGFERNKRMLLAGCLLKAMRSRDIYTKSVPIYYV